ncbi:hypothetical protein E2C01_030155 [Portunus trituberculatus]|uniref:Uncharacterized protein n=1 Tax=Portunus trituberculatus TaxID=210409 RepID=A0A5B7ETZ5_PORTR|nr:hypothetical protein [Portunus trituberculatus]
MGCHARHGEAREDGKASPAPALLHTLVFSGARRESWSFLRRLLSFVSQCLSTTTTTTTTNTPHSLPFGSPCHTTFKRVTSHAATRTSTPGRSERRLVLQTPV